MQRTFVKKQIFRKNLLTNEATGDNIYKLSARNASGAILENDTENEKQENSRFGKELRNCLCSGRWRVTGMNGKD